MVVGPRHRSRALAVATLMRQRDETLRALLRVVEIDGRIEAGFVHWLAATQSALAALDAAGDGEKLTRARQR